MFRLVTTPVKFAPEPLFTGTERLTTEGNRTLLVEQRNADEWEAWFEDDHGLVGFGSTREEAIGEML